jgi:glycosyltransferase involved in cell wall biosynthesis
MLASLNSSKPSDIALQNSIRYMITVSILINTYNYAQYLPQAIESALGQTHPLHEVIVVDDGSVDETEASIRPKFEKLKSIKWIRQENAGQLAAIQTAIDASTSDICFFLDADDYYEPDYVSLMVGYYQKHPLADFVFSEPAKFSGETGQSEDLSAPKSYDYGISIIRELTTQAFIGRPTSTLSIKKKILDQLFPFPDDVIKTWKICADECLIRGASLAGANKHYYGIQRVNYRIHGNNLFQGSKSTDIYHKYERERNICSLINHLKKKFHIHDNHLELGALEYKTIPRPSPSDTKLYKRIVKYHTGFIKKNRKNFTQRILRSFKKSTGKSVDK